MTTEVLLDVKGLKTWFSGKQRPFKAVDGIDFQIRHGETLALLGESGCGKSISALSLLRLNPSPISQIMAGEVNLKGQDLLKLSEAEMETIRGRRIAMIFQEPQSSLNPVLTVGRQIGESLRWHCRLSRQEIKQRSLALLDAVGIPDPHRRLQEYPHQLSGGMKQRVMIAMALAGEPELLIADEPTTALDVTIQAQILALLKQIQQETGMAILLITHDLGVAAQMADQVAVMYAGQIVEMADQATFFKHPRHPYSQKLFAALPSEQKREQRLTIIEGHVPALDQDFVGCRFAERCDKAWSECHQQTPRWLSTNNSGVRCHLYDEQLKTVEAPTNTPRPVSHLSDVVPSAIRALELRDMKVHFPIRTGILQRQTGQVKAVDGVSLTINNAETVALVGESGCGKTTVGMSILQLIRPTSGEVRFQGKTLNRLSQRELQPYRGQLQIIFQDPFTSMNPRMTIEQIIEEAINAKKMLKEAKSKSDYIDALLKRVGLSKAVRQRYPHEFSGGQRQRICIARALATEPELIVCDEPTSALDVSVQAQILNLLRDIQHEFGLSYLFITHDIGVVDYLAHRVAVMYLGKIVEQGSRQQVLNSPKHPYTQTLLAAVPGLEKQALGNAAKGELPSPANPPPGCHFHQRCPYVMTVCTERYPQTVVLDKGRQVNCFLYEENVKWINKRKLS